MNNIKQIKIITHYCKGDTQFMSDHCGKDLYIDGDLVEQYGEECDDSAAAKIDGFFDCLKYLGLGHEAEVIEQNVADYEC